MKMLAACFLLVILLVNFTETSVDFNRTILRHILEDITINIHYCENLSSI
jgi:hypothetical protein